ncbi:MAG: serine/threonine-protein phosphatase, partial [Treponema sp.]|nr:serine/threonine-protein phosphatase [Treponema sp.]
MPKLCTDLGYVSLNKYGEQLCGDHVEIAYSWQSEYSRVFGEGMKNGYSIVVVLADGLGSGVKANILSTLTAKIISTMMANSLTVEDCVSTIVAALPVRAEIGIAYSTFTIITIKTNQEAEIIQYDNPRVIFLRDGKLFDYPVIAETIDGKTIYKTRIMLQEGDTFVAMSDGVINAGTGPELNLNWERNDVASFLESIYDPHWTAKTLSAMLINKCYSLYGGKPGDDTTVCTVKLRARRQVNMLIGPPRDPNDLSKMMSLFFSKEGRHIISGGTTSALAAEFLKRALVTDLPPSRSAPDIPPIAKIEGVDLVTEGIITLRKVAEYAADYAKDNENYADWNSGDDGASMIARLLFEEATDINFFVGKA